MRMHKDGVKAKILSYLSINGFAKRSAFIDIFHEYSKTTINASVKFLVDEGFVSEERKYLDGKHKVRVLSLAEKGRVYLADYVSEEEIENQKDYLGYIRSGARREAVSTVHTCLRSYGVLFGEDRPPLAVLSGRQEVREEDIERANVMQERGAFYDIMEIRNESAILFGEGPLNQTRCIGAIIRKRRVYLVYNMTSKLILFNPSVEERTKGIVLRVFRSRQERSSCVLFGSSGNAIFKLLYNNPKGTHPALLNRSTYNTNSLQNIMKNKLSLRKLANLFSEVYFLPSQKRSEAFDTATYLSKDEMRQKVNTLLGMLDGVRTEEGIGGTQGTDTRTGQRLFVWLDNDILSLYQLYRATGALKENSVRVITTSKNNAEICSRILGPRLTTATSLRGEPYQVQRYDAHAKKL